MLTCYQPRRRGPWIQPHESMMKKSNYPVKSWFDRLDWVMASVDGVHNETIEWTTIVDEHCTGKPSRIEPTSGFLDFPGRFPAPVGLLTRFLVYRHSPSLRGNPCLNSLNPQTSQAPRGTRH